MATSAERPETRTNRYYARDQRSFTGPMKFSVFNTAPNAPPSQCSASKVTRSARR
jgi:hypothetical protein